MGIGISSTAMLDLAAEPRRVQGNITNCKNSIDIVLKIIIKVQIKAAGNFRRN